GRDVERLEVVVLRLDLGPLLDREAEAVEEVDDLALDARDRVQAAARQATTRKRHVEPPAELPVLGGALERLAPRAQERLDALLRRVGPLAGGSAFGRRQRADAVQQRGERALPSQETRTHLGPRPQARRPPRRAPRLRRQP